MMEVGNFIRLKAILTLTKSVKVFNSVSNPLAHPIPLMPSQSKPFAPFQRLVFDSISGPMAFPIGATMELMQEVMECRTVLQMGTFAKR